MYRSQFLTLSLATHFGAGLNIGDRRRATLIILVITSLTATNQDIVYSWLNTQTINVTVISPNLGGFGTTWHTGSYFTRKNTWAINTKNDMCNADDYETRSDSSKHAADRPHPASAVTSHVCQHQQQFTFAHDNINIYTLQTILTNSSWTRNVFWLFPFSTNPWAIHVSCSSSGQTFCRSSASTCRFRCRCRPASGILDPSCSDNPSPNHRHLTPTPESSVTLLCCPLPRMRTPERSQRAVDWGQSLRRVSVCLCNR